MICRTLTELVEIPREKLLDDDEGCQNDSAAMKMTCSQSEADMLGLVFANLLR